MSSQLNDLRLQVERLGYDNKEGSIALDMLKEQNVDVTAELEEVRKQLAELKAMQKDPSSEDKEKRKQEKMALMMAKFDSVSSNSINVVLLKAYNFQQQGAFSDKEEQLRQILIKLDSIESAEPLTSEDLTNIRRQLSEGQSMLKDTVDRLRHVQEMNELLSRRKDELETRVTSLESEYEELLGEFRVVPCDRSVD